MAALQDTVRDLHRRRADALGLAPAEAEAAAELALADSLSLGGGQAGSLGGAPLLPLSAGPSLQPHKAGSRARSHSRSPSPRRPAGAAGGSAGGATLPLLPEEASASLGGAPGRSNASGGGGGSGGPGGGASSVALLGEGAQLERLLADRTRAFHLLHADFLVKKAELEEARCGAGGGRRRDSRAIAAGRGGRPHVCVCCCCCPVRALCLSHTAGPPTRT